MFKKMNLPTKLLLGFSIPLLVIVGMALDVYGVTRWIKESVKMVEVQNTDSFAFAILAQRMHLDVVEVQQSLTDVSATRGQDGLDTGFAEAEKSRQSFLAGLSKFREMDKGKNSLDNLKQLDEIERAFAAYYEEGKKMANAYVASGPAGGNKLMGEFDKKTDVLSEEMEKFVHAQMLQGQSALGSIPSSLDKLLRNISIFAILGLALGVIVAWSTTRSISRTLRNIILGLWESADQVGAASGQVSSASQELAEGASEQAASIEETSSSLEEMASMTKQNAANANQANDLMSRTKQVVAQANGSMGHLTISMGEISRASEETSKIIKTIDEIAFQTNLLALNAAVEAARAGEAGAGFAVVADEVRNLAMRAADSAKNTANLIEGTVKKIKEGSEIVKNTNVEFSQVEISAGKMGELIGEISAASGEQAQGIEQISKTVSEMDKVVQQNSANAEESAAASEEMNAQATQLKEFIGDLVALVGGANGSRLAQNSATSFRKKMPKKAAAHTVASHAGHREKEKSSGHPQNGNGKALPYYGNRGAGPEQIVPFDAEVSDC